MKKRISIVVLVILGAITLAMPALAATTISLSPPNIVVTEGQNFNVAVQIDPESVKNYTAKIQIQYPAELLTAESFTFGGNWMALSQPGYDLIDNENGVLIKTAGYPSGFSKAVTFGTVSFSTKKVGNGIIKIGGESVVLDGTNHNVFGNAVVQSSIIITASLPPAEQLIPPEEETAPPALFDILTQPEAKQSQRNLLMPILAGVGIIILGIAGYIIYRKRKREIV